MSLDPALKEIASQLGVPPRAQSTQIIVEKCINRVAGWCAELGPVSTLPELLALVAAKLRLRFEVLSEDDDLAVVREKYLKLGELAFVDLDREFNATTDAVVIRLQHQPKWSDVRYVAVIDGRGQKKSRVWFSEWHEAAHLIAEPQTKFIFRRTQAFKRDPVERLMDQIAAALAFYDPIYLPALKRSVKPLSAPSLRQLAEFASAECPFASLQATLQSAIRHVRKPAILIEAKPGLKVEELRKRAAGQQSLFAEADNEYAVPRLRAVTAAHNTAAQRAKIFIHRNMRVPDVSVITRCFNGEEGSEFEVTSENLSSWKSGGESLPDMPMTVEAMQAGFDRVLALCLFE